MGFVIIPGRENGYPCISALPETRVNRNYPPVPQYTLKTYNEDVNGGYPCIADTEGYVPQALRLYFGSCRCSSAYFGSIPVVKLIMGEES